MTLGERLKQLRLNKNISQKDLAKHFNIARSTLSQYESNQREPSLQMLLKISDYFNVSVDELLKDHCTNDEGLHVSTIKQIVMEGTKEIEVDRIDCATLDIVRFNIENQLKLKNIGNNNPQNFKVLTTYYSVLDKKFYGTVAFYEEGE